MSQPDREHSRMMEKEGIPLMACQVRQAAKLMARSFYDDPFFTFVLPDGERRRNILPWLFEKTVWYGQRYGKVYTTASLEGIAMWLGPQKPVLEWTGTLLTGLFLLPLKLSRQELGKSLRLANSARKLHEQSISGQHWYLVELGVEPARQGDGVGAALLQPVLARADQESQACYLDTNNELNIQFYERFGFRLAGTAHAIQSGPKTWGMLREPGYS